MRGYTKKMFLKIMFGFITIVSIIMEYKMVIGFNSLMIITFGCIALTNFMLFLNEFIKEDKGEDV